MLEDIKARDGVERFSRNCRRVGQHLNLRPAYFKKSFCEAFADSGQLEICHAMATGGEVQAIKTETIADTEHIKRLSGAIHVAAGPSPHPAFLGVSIPNEQFIQEGIGRGIKLKQMRSPNVARAAVGGEKSCPPRFLPVGCFATQDRAAGETVSAGPRRSLR